MKIRCLAIDDEPDALEKLCSYIRHTPFLELVAACEDTIEAMDVMSRESIDAVFIDISMPDLNGLDFISSLSFQPLTVFITAYADYAVESYRVRALDYILKPYGFAEFQRAAGRIAKSFDESAQAAAPSEKPTSVFIKTDYRWVRIETADILYIQGYSDYLRFYLRGKPTPILTNSNFASVRKSLPSNFLQVHRSYIVNMDCIAEVERSRIVIDKNTVIPVGDSYKADFLSYLNRFGVSRNKLDPPGKPKE